MWGGHAGHPDPADYLTIRGFLVKSGDQYQPTPVTRAFLDRASPSCMGSIIDFMAAPEFMAMFQDDPLAYVRNGGSPGLANVAADDPVWIEFAHAMAPFVRDKAELVARHVATWTRQTQSRARCCRWPWPVRHCRGECGGGSLGHRRRLAELC